MMENYRQSNFFFMLMLLRHGGEDEQGGRWIQVVIRTAVKLEHKFLV